MKRVAAFDVETDPFKEGRIVEPFCCGFYDGRDYVDFWGEDCIAQFIEYLDGITEPMVIYVHNGGHFDFFFMLWAFEDELRIVNRRIIKAWRGRHEFRDSYAIIPEKLEDFGGKNQKIKFDYDKMERGNRYAFQAEIREYLMYDCLALHEGVTKFLADFGNHLTVGGAAMKHLRRFHTVASGGPAYDANFRPYYFGGRCQCFNSGIISGDFRIYDVNGMYPYVMKEYKHPISVAFEWNRYITPKTTFAFIEAHNYGALPVREKNGINFTIEKGVFYASIHEIIAGEETGTLRIIKVKQAIEHKEVGTFGEFVDYAMERKISCEKKGDKLGRSINKRLANACYGKFAQDPANYKDHCITHSEMMPEPWTIGETNGEYIIWERASQRRQYYNIATAASITGASRAVLLRGLSGAIDPVYCDTDSIICRGFRQGPQAPELDATKIGAWKLEGNGNKLAIAGKKLYAVFSGNDCIKQASKGVSLEPDEICDVASGEIVEYANPVPRFQLYGGATFTTRRVKRTGTAKSFRARSHR